MQMLLRNLGWLRSVFKSLQIIFGLASAGFDISKVLTCSGEGTVVESLNSRTVACLLSVVCCSEPKEMEHM